MLVLKRKVNESIMIGDEIEITVISTDKDGIRIGISAPKEMPIYRKEIYVEIQQANLEATKMDQERLGDLSNLLKDIQKI